MPKGVYERKKVPGKVPRWRANTPPSSRLRQFEPFDRRLKWTGEQQERRDALNRGEAVAASGYRVKLKGGAYGEQADETLIRWGRARRVVISVDGLDYGPGPWIEPGLEGEEYLSAYSRLLMDEPLSDLMLEFLRGKVLVSRRQLAESHAVLLAQEVNLRLGKV